MATIHYIKKDNIKIDKKEAVKLAQNGGTFFVALANNINICYKITEFAELYTNAKTLTNFAKLVQLNFDRYIKNNFTNANARLVYYK